MSHTVGCKTHAGKVRDTNQDGFAVLRRKDLDNVLDGVFIVADGMGGTGGKSGGEVASRTVVETLTDGFVEWAYEKGGSVGTANLNPLLTEVIERANNRVWMKQIERPELSGMGTTCLVGVLRENKLTLGHAGDSRVYLLRKGKLSQLTQDHSTVWQEVLAGTMTREEAANSKFRNQVTKAIGLQQRDVDPEIQNYELDEGDTLLFCTDGLTTEVSDIEIAKILASVPPAQDAADRLVDAALRHGGSDNVTVMVVRYGVFQPISGASVIETQLRTPRPTVAEDEEMTDPDANWRKPKNGKQQSLQSKPTPIREERQVTAQDEEEEEEPDEERAPRRRRNRQPADETAKGGSSLLISLLVVALIACVAEGIALAIALKNRNVQVPVIPTIRAKQNDDVTTRLLAGDKPMLYTGIKTLYEKTPLREDYLELDEQGGAYVIGTNGKFIHVESDKIANPLPRVLPVPPASKPDPKRLYTRFDIFGNMYQTFVAKTGETGISKFDFAGTRREPDIANGQLLQPQAFAFDKDRHLYVLDEKKLKYIPAVVYRKMGEPQLDDAPETAP